MYLNHRRKNILLHPKKQEHIKRQIRVKSPKSILIGVWGYMKIYFEHCSIHGLSFIVRKGLTLPERIVWVTLIVVCLHYCIFIGLESVYRFRFKSTVIGVERNYHYWNTSVPSLTVCPMKRLDKDLFDQYCRDKNITNSTSQEEFFNFLEKLANSTYFNFKDIPIYDSIDDTLEYLGIEPENYMELIYNLTRNYVFSSGDSMKISATDGRGPITTRQVLTEYGICYMTNSELGPEYSTDFALFGRFPPLSNNESDAKNVIKGSFFDADVTIDFMGFSESGVDSYLHSTDETPRVDSNVGLSTEAIEYTGITMDVITDENFESDVTINQRKCRFHHESNLKHFPLYTKNLCLQECRLELALKICGCIPHFYPNRISSPKPVCNYKILRECFPSNEAYLLKFYDVSDNKRERVHCKCERNCVDTIVTLNKILFLTATKSLFGDSVGVRMTVDSWPRKRLKRQVVYSATDLLVSIGSTIGLFLGFSVLSLIEFLYFFTLRLFWHLKGYKIQ